MITICVTVCIVVAIICATVYFIVREKYYAVSDLSQQQLLEDINIRCLNVYNKYLDEYNSVLSEGSNLRNTRNDFFQCIEDVVEMTIDYKKQQKD